MSTRTPVVALEDAIGAQLMVAQFGAGSAPVVTRRYRILELRGRGANGVVCRARDTKLNRIVALKLYPRFDDESIERETLREAQALARLEHPNVVRIYDHDRGVVESIREHGVHRWPSPQGLAGGVPALPRRHAACAGRRR